MRLVQSVDIFTTGFTDTGNAASVTHILS
jgi:hypothetical protein